jgi:hypothetical protein
MPPKGACQISSGKDAKSLNFAHPIRQAGGKEQLADHGSKNTKMMKS